MSQFKSQEIVLVGISSSGVEDHAAIGSKIGAEFPILADPDGVAIRAYGVSHPGALPGFDGPVARPAVFLISEDGIILDRLLTENWRVRARPEHVLEAFERLR